MFYVEKSIQTKYRLIDIIHRDRVRKVTIDIKNIVC
jgi:hypothetical protein